MRTTYLYSFRGRGRRIGALGISEPFAIDLQAYSRKDAIALLYTIREHIEVCSVIRHKGGIAS